MTPLDRYLQLIAQDKILEDPRQRIVIEKLQKIYLELTTSQSRFLRKPKPVKGLYLWGSVGAGKTLLLDIFYDCLPMAEKSRMHFHQFMQQVHQELTQLQGNSNPLTLIAKKFTHKIKVLCFDELLVTNIVDAMLLAELFKALFSQGICIIFTSNTAPEELYKTGLQRQRFLPVIELIKHHTEVVAINSTTDYRLHHADKGKYYWTPLDEVTAKNMEESFLEFSHHQEIDFKPLIIHDRIIAIKKRANGVVWFDFMDICGVPRSQHDYLTIAEKFHTVLISNVTKIQAQQNDLAQSFIRLVDVFYDAKIRLIISAAVPIEELYTSGKLSFDFVRTRSRLIEMSASLRDFGFGAT